MSRKYKFYDQSLPYFVSFATVQWVDVFTRDNYREVIVQSLRYCQRKKGLIVYAWCIMTNHVHLIIGTTSMPMQDIMRDFKSYTSREIRKELGENPQESRRSWMKPLFMDAGKENANNKDWQFWQQHNQPIELWDNYMMEQKLNYLHENPVVAGFVSSPEDWVWSSARDYCGEKGVLEIERLD